MSTTTTLSRIAQITYAAVDAHARSLHGDELFQGQYIVSSTSGTTGTPTHILYNRQEWATLLASFTRFEQHIGSFRETLRRPKMAVVASATPWHMSARIFATIQSSWLPNLRLDVGEPLEEIVHKLNGWQPELLATYASMVGILAEEQAAGRLHINPRRIVSSAEVMSTSLRRRIQAVWGDIVFDQYGATEGGTFAVECDAGHLSTATGGGRTRGMHLFEDLFILENVDHQNRPVAPGRYGDKLLLTVLYKYTQPLIRYELSDSLKMAAQPCSCGRALTLIEDIQGRREEVLQFPNGNRGAVSVHPMVFYRILDAAPVTAWQIVQIDSKILQVRLSGNSARVDEQTLVRSLQDALERQKAEPVAVEVKWMTEMERNATGKAPRILSRGRGAG